MASYGLKYEAEFQNTKKHFYRVRIYRRGYTGASKTIGYVAGAAFEVQGNQVDIIAPIIKTQLRVSIVDAPDLAETSAVKYGDWQEFFTPDATLYKVVLGQSLDGTDYTDIWSGYLTPDSWVEDINYRGIITITARDGLGQLKDYPFEASGLCTPDENGLISIYAILHDAKRVFGMPMDIVSYIGTSEIGYKPPRFSAGEYTDISIESASVNAALFEGMDWYQVLEQTLEAIGCAIRYNGQNALIIMALRDLPKLGRSDGAFEYNPVEFYGGTLEFMPAVKRIVEEQDYKQRAEVDFPVFDGLQFNAGTTYRCKTEGNTLPAGGTVSIPEHDAAMNTLSNKGKTGWDLASGMLNPAAYEADDFLKRAEGVDGWRNYAFIAANQVLNGSAPVATYRFVTRTAAIKTTFRFTPNALSITMSGSQTGRMMGPHYALANIKYYVMFTDGTTTRYWNGSQWTSTAILLEKEYDAQNQYETTLEINTSECADITVGTFVVELGQIIYKMWSDGGHGCYARVVEIKAEINSTTSIQSNKVTTINDDAFNVVLTRKPLFGALSQEVSFVRPSNYLAALFTYTSYHSNPAVCPYNFRFGSETPVPLPVLIHQQILCYYYGAARVLNGNCAPINNGRIQFDRICTYNNIRYIIQGGTLDLFSGVLMNAVLREYLDFDELWDGSTPEYSGGPTYQADPASGGGSGSSGGGGGGGGYVLPIASASTLGGVKVGSGLSIDQNGVLSSQGGGGYTLPVATAGALGGIRIGYSQTGKNYPVQLDNNNKAYVNVPWEGGGGGGGTVTSVDMTVPTGSGFKVEGNPITGSGTLAVSLISQAKNKFLASPANASGVPTFRVLASSDIPDLSGKYVTLDTTQNNISGEKTFTTKPVHIAANSGIDVNGNSYIDIGEVRLVYDSTNKALHITTKSGNETIGVYADGFVSARGAAASGDQIKFVTLTGAQSVDGIKTFLANIIANGTITINGVTLTGSSSKLSLNKNASFAGISDRVNGSNTTHEVSIQDIVNRLVALENA